LIAGLPVLTQVRGLSVRNHFELVSLQGLPAITGKHLDRG
jgi:hypothetical protein